MPHKIIPETRRNFAKQLRYGQTKLEARLWYELRAHRLDGWKFKRQVPLEGYVVDFVCHEASLVIEVDGPLHRKPEHILRDKQRDSVLRRRGFRILRFDEDIALGRIVADIRDALAKTPLPASD